MRMQENGSFRHGQFNPHEVDYNSTPYHSSCTLLQALQTLNPISFRVNVIGGNWTSNAAYNGNASYERAQSTVVLSELNSDFNSITYNGGA